jgi:hypothetical protein
MYGSAYMPGLSYPEIASLAQTTDAGGHWQFVPLQASPGNNHAYPGRQPGDPKLFRDPVTNRVFYSNDAPPCGTSDLAVSDDDGASWTVKPSPTGAVVQGCTPWDYEVLFTGAPRTSTMTSDYPNIVYFCASTHMNPDRQCYKSLDGAETFTEIPGSGANNPVVADSTGVIYGSGNGTLTRSVDEGKTWTSTPVPAGFGGAITGAPAVDSRGNVYLLGTVDKLPALTYSTDKGAHWSAPVVVAMPGLSPDAPRLRHFDTAAFVVGKPGQVAVAYIGNSDTADTPSVPPYHSGGPHHGFITTTDNLLTAQPVFHSVQVDSDTDPLMPYGWATANSSADGALTSRIDYIGIDISRSGQPWAYFIKDRCAHTACATEGDTLKSSDTAFSTWAGAVATTTKR